MTTIVVVDHEAVAAAKKDDHALVATKTGEESIVNHMRRMQVRGCWAGAFLMGRPHAHPRRQN